MADKTTEPTEQVVNTGEFWANFAKAESATRNSLRNTAAVNQRAVTLAAQAFQSQLLGLVLLSESEQQLIHTSAVADEAPSVNP